MVSREFSDSREQATHIYLDGAVISNPRSIVAKDPWSGVKTMWMPIYYVQQALKQAGFQIVSAILFMCNVDNIKYGDSAIDSHNNRWTSLLHDDGTDQCFF